MSSLDVSSVPMPRLLVSVRSVAEARAALEGGAAIIDVKEPSHGSLGMAAVTTIGEIARCVQAETARVPLSAALGELVDWDRASLPQLPDTLNYLKLGLSQMGQRPDWVKRWSQVRLQFDGNVPRPERWIAVAYVDWQAASAPRPEAVIRAARDARCAGVLFDTWSKRSGRLSDWASLEQLRCWRRALPAEQMLMAVAGRLTVGELAHALAMRPDVVAIRSAACRDGSRENPVATEAVLGFRQALQTASSQAAAGFNRSGSKSQKNPVFPRGKTGSL